MDFTNLQSTLNTSPSDLLGNGKLQTMRKLGADGVVDVATLLEGEHGIIIKAAVSR
ncbi:MAG: hypothetical protein ABIR84_02975 [Candidatus Nitrotoga sp.]